jgi:hypothetical protein
VLPGLLYYFEGRASSSELTRQSSRFLALAYNTHLKTSRGNSCVGRNLHFYALLVLQIHGQKQLSRASFLNLLIPNFLGKLADQCVNF